MISIRRACIRRALASIVCGASLALSSAVSPLAWAEAASNTNAAADLIQSIEVEGNAKVEAAAILNLIQSKKGEPLRQSLVRSDIRALYKLGYFSDIQVFKQAAATPGWHLIFKVQEKPAITSITFQGLDEIKQEDIEKSLETKLYTIVNEASIMADMRLIEKKYAEKGFYLAKVTYTLEAQGKNEVALVFHADERGKVLVGEVNILGNHFFSDGELLDKLALRPFTRWSATFGTTSLFHDDLLKRDLEFISYYYKDHGFADVKVGKPVTVLDADKQFMRVSIELEEGLQYRVESLKVTGDVGEGLFSEAELIEAMQLKPGELFRYSLFSKDVELLVDKYGDLGYAYADVNPQPIFDKEKQRVQLTYHITKGQKVYFGAMTIIGNTKTRDNVIRRELEVHDSQLYSGTGLSNSKANVNRLGFFEEVQVYKERDPEAEDLVNLKFKVKEKPTGQLQASVGFSPAAATTAGSSKWFAQGRYDEKNQSGKGWDFNLTGKYGGKHNYEMDTGFYNPRVNDSKWSYGLNLSYKLLEAEYATGAKVLENQQSVSTQVGRDLFEKVRGHVIGRHTEVFQQGQRVDIYLLEDSRNVGVKNSLTLGLSRRKLDNYLDPSQGTDLSVNHKVTGGPFGGHYDFMESTADADFYLPWDVSESYRTYLKTHAHIGKLWTLHGKRIPGQERYRLGFYDLRGYRYASVGPKDRRALGPQGGFTDYNVGGDKKLYFQWEYFMPLIPQAGIKALVFADMGQVYLEEEPYSLNLRKLKKDVGFGFRWITPIAPFRFEWAYPYDDERRAFGDMEFIFNIGF